MATRQLMVDLCDLPGWKTLSDWYCNQPYEVGTIFSHEEDTSHAVAYLCGLQKGHKGKCE